MADKNETSDPRSGLRTTLTEEEQDALDHADYQVFNNGIGVWAVHPFTDLEKYVQVLRKRDSELDRRVTDLLIRAMTADTQLRAHQQEVDNLPESEEFHSTKDAYLQIVDTCEEKLDQCEQEYRDLAPEFMASYGLVDYGTAFDQVIKSVYPST